MIRQMENDMIFKCEWKLREYVLGDICLVSLVCCAGIVKGEVGRDGCNWRKANRRVRNFYRR